MGGHSAGGLLALPVRHRGIDLGRAVDVLLDLEAGRALGLEVVCRDDAHRFLPLGAARIHRDGLEVGSALTLLDDLAFYRNRGYSLRTVRGGSAQRAGKAVGVVTDLLLGDDGEIEALLVESGPSTVRIPFGRGITFEAAERQPVA